MTHDLIKEMSKEDPRLKTFEDQLSSDVHFMYDFDCPPLDIAYGGGISSGKIYEIFGRPSQGKSTLALEITRAFDKYWKKKEFDKYGVLLIETESAFDKPRTKYMDCPVDRFIISSAELVEDAYEIMESFLKKCKEKGMVGLIIWDTLAAASTKNEKNHTGGPMMEKPKKIKEILRNLTHPIGETNSTLILVNQVYDGGDGAIPESPGGQGVKFHSSVRSYLRRTEYIKRVEANGTEVIDGLVVEINQVKNKITSAGKCHMVIYGNTGLDTLETCFRYIRNAKLISMAGSWASIEFPKALNQNTTTPEMIKKSFQNISSLRECIKNEYPHLKDWIHYLIYKHFCQSDPLLKTRIIKKTWEFEKLFFSSQVTTLTDKELEVAKLQHKGLMEESKGTVNSDAFLD